jgi:hypothetical protein
MRPYAGAYLPIGGEREAIDDGSLGGLQMSFVLHPRLAVTVNFGMAATKIRDAAEIQPLVLSQLDVGVEWRPREWRPRALVHFSPFVGFGLGMRTMDYRDLDVESQSRSDGDFAFGGELRVGPIGFRVETRDYLVESRRFSGGDARARVRSDLSIAAGFSFHLYPAP